MVASDYVDAAERVQDLQDDLGDEIDRQVGEGTEDLQSAAKANLRANDAIATGATKRGIVHQDGPAAMAYASAPGPQTVHVSAVSSTAPWSGYLERGTGVHGPYDAPSPKPPVENIQDWIEAKPIVGREYRATTKAGEMASPLAYAIAESIGELFGTVPGTPAQPYMLPAWHQAYPDIVQRGRNALSTARRRF